MRRTGTSDARSVGRRARSVLWEIAVLAALAVSAVSGTERVQVGVNDYTGKPIFMSTGMTHPVTVDYRGRDGDDKPDAREIETARKALSVWAT